MRIKKLKNSAFTLIEVLLSAVIFIVTIAGLFVTLGSVRAPVASKQTALTAAVFEKQVLEALRSQVSLSAGANYNACAAGTGNVLNPCQDFSLSLGTHQVSAATLANYNISWPTLPATLQTNNTIVCAGVANTLCLQYVVSCADGSGNPGTNTACTNVDIPHQVNLKVCLDAVC